MAKISEKGYFEGTASAHFGEFLQGCLPSNTPFLVSCPITMQCSCRIYKNVFPKQQTMEQKKARFLTLFEKICHIQIKNKIQFKSNIPHSIGMGSSTSDLVALFRALNQIVENKYSMELFGKIASKIEPSDGTLYNGLLVFNHYLAKPIYFIKNIIPDFIIVGVIEDRIVDTLEYNKSVHYSKQEQDEYTQLLKDFIYACEYGNLEMFSSVAIKSIQMNFKRNYHHFFKYLKPLVDEKIALGIIGSHSGSCSGVFISTQDVELKDKVNYIKTYLIKKGLSPIVLRSKFSSLSKDP